MQGNQNDQLSGSLQGARGPLPDVIPQRGRGRAYSEGTLYRSHEEIGRSLADMCDQFSQVHVNRQRTLNLMVSVFRGINNIVLTLLCNGCLALLSLAWVET